MIDLILLPVPVELIWNIFIPTVITGTIENLPGRFYLFRKGRFSGAGWRCGQVFEKGGFDAKMT